MAYYIIFIPGIKGSSIKFVDTNEEIWPPKAIILSKMLSCFSNKTFLTKVEQTLLKYNRQFSTRPMEFHIIKEVKCCLFSFDVYGIFVKKLKKMAKHIEQKQQQNLAFVKVLVFAYDWRQSLRLSALNLYDFLKKHVFPNAVNGVEYSLIGHSFGGLVARYFSEIITVEKSIKLFPKCVICMASPHNGSFSALSYLTGIKSDPLTSETVSKEILNSYDSLYELVPFKQIAKMYTDKNIKQICQRQRTHSSKPLLEKHDFYEISVSDHDISESNWDRIVFNLRKYFSFWNFDFCKLRKAYLTMGSLNLINKPKPSTYTFINALGCKTPQYICPDRNVLSSFSGDGSVSAFLLTNRINSTQSKLSKLIKDEDNNVHLSLLKQTNTIRLINDILQQSITLPFNNYTLQNSGVYAIVKIQYGTKIILQVNAINNLKFSIDSLKNSKMNYLNVVIEEFTGHTYMVTFKSCFTTLSFEINTSYAIKNVNIDCSGNEFQFQIEK